MFRQYILWGATYEQLSSLSGYTIAHLVDVFHKYLDTSPPNLPLIPQTGSDETFLLIDGLWFGRWFVLMVYRQHKNLTILHISSMGREVSSKIEKDLLWIKTHYTFTGVVSDGGTGIVAAVSNVYPHTPHQHCLVHLYRDATNGLGKHPKDPRVVKLKKLADHLFLIESQEALAWWKRHVKQWVEEHWSFLHEYRRDEQGHWWYIHKGARKTVRILKTAPKTSFVFLEYPTMPKTTNEIEAQFGHLGKRWRAHQGLKRERWESFLKWFVYFYNLDKLTSRNRKKAIKNNTKS
ncbi:transposase [Candidatus Roizmanbacteria bacterium]|nr:transposase [Candidatus Roizmanbacteria bacterium]